MTECTCPFSISRPIVHVAMNAAKDAMLMSAEMPAPDVRQIITILSLLTKLRSTEELL
jgi:hypothetical protein